MNSAKALTGLPPVFFTRDYTQATGVRPSSASRALGELADNGLVEKIRWATWRNLAVEIPPARDWLIDPGPISHFWTPEWETELEAAYGDMPRRISGLTALGMAGVALICQPEVTVEAEFAFDTGAFGFASWRETASTLFAGAMQLTEHTWVSTPARAVLECAQYPYRSHRYEEYFGRMITNRFDVCSPNEVGELAGVLGWCAGLRRLSSLAEGLMESPVGHDLGFDADPNWAELNRVAGRGDDWIHLTPLLRRTDNQLRIVEQDTKRLVNWGIRKDGLAGLVST